MKHQIRFGGTFGHSFNFRLETNGLKNPPGLTGCLMQEEREVKRFKEFLNNRKNNILSFNLIFKCCMWLLYKLHTKHDPQPDTEMFRLKLVIKVKRVELYCMNITVHSTCRIQCWKYPTNSTQFSVWHKMHHDVFTILIKNILVFFF